MTDPATIVTQGRTWDYGWYYNHAYDLMYAYLKHVEEPFKHDIQSYLLTLVDRVYNEFTGTEGYKYSIFKELSKDYIDNYFHKSVQSQASNLANWFQSRVDADLKGYTKAVTTQAEGVVTDVGDLAAEALRRLGESVSSVDDLITGAQQDIFDTAQKVALGVDDLFSKVEAQLSATHSATVAKIEEDHDALVQILQDVYNKTADNIDGWYQQSISDSRVIVDNALSAISGLYAEAEARLSGDVDEVVGQISETVDPVVLSVGQSSEQLASLSNNLSSSIAPHLATLAVSKLTNLGIPDTKENVTLAQKNNRDMSNLFQVLAGAVGGREDMDNAFEILDGQDSIPGYLFSSVIYTLCNAFMMISAAKISNAAREQELLQNVFANKPNTDYTPDEAAQHLARHMISETDATSAGLRSGVAPDKMAVKYAAAQTPVDRTTATQAWLRGAMNNDSYVANLRRLGYNDSDIMYVAEMSKLIPPVNDLISMAVREVFSPDIASRFKLFDDLPKEFVEWAGKQGLTEEWAKRYWGAHWRLPSAQEGFAMYHRKLIDKDTLDLLIRALDVSPIWREPLKGIAYQPITRVDIRRIYQLGLIDRTEVKRRFEIGGYSPDDAELMTQFYEVYTGAEDGENPLDPKEITLAQVKKLREIGTITVEQAIEQLITVGYDRDLATIYVQSWIDEKAYNDRAKLINRYTRRAIREDMNNSEIETLVYELNLTAEELRNVKQTVEAERSEFDSIPSKSELFAMLKAGIIDQDTWYVYMRKHGYTDEIIGWYYQLKA